MISITVIVTVTTTIAIADITIARKRVQDMCIKYNSSLSPSSSCLAQIRKLAGNQGLFCQLCDMYNPLLMQLYPDDE